MTNGRGDRGPRKRKAPSLTSFKMNRYTDINDVIINRRNPQCISADPGMSLMSVRSPRGSGGKNRAGGRSGGITSALISVGGNVGQR